MKGDFHVRFCENAGVKLLCVTQLAVIFQNHLMNSLKWVIVYLCIFLFSN